MQLLTETPAATVSLIQQYVQIRLYALGHSQTLDAKGFVSTVLMPMVRAGVVETNSSRTLFSLSGTSEAQIENALRVVDGQQREEEPEPVRADDDDYDEEAEEAEEDEQRPAGRPEQKTRLLLSPDARITKVLEIIYRTQVFGHQIACLRQGTITADHLFVNLTPRDMLELFRMYEYVYRNSYYDLIRDDAAFDTPLHALPIPYFALFVRGHRTLGLCKSLL